MSIIVVQSLIFQQQIKKLHKNQKVDLDMAVYKILADPSLGEFKTGDLHGIQVYKFRMVGMLTLLAYDFFEDQLQLHLILLGSHENFYRDLKK